MIKTKRQAQLSVLSSFQKCKICQRDIENKYLPIHQTRCSRRTTTNPTKHHKQDQHHQTKCKYCSQSILKRKLKTHQQQCKIDKKKCQNCLEWIHQTTEHNNCGIIDTEEQDHLVHEITMKLQDSMDPHLTIQLPLNHSMRPANLIYNLFISALEGNGEIPLQDLITQGKTIQLSNRATRQLRRRTIQTSKTMSNSQIQQNLANMVFALLYNEQSIQQGLSMDQILDFRRKIYVDDGECSLMCSICQCDFLDGEKLMVLRCYHDFHQECLSPWLRINSACPICKQCQK